MPATPLSRHAEDVFIEDNGYWLGDPDDPDSPIHTGDMPTPDVTGLIATSAGAVQVTCGIHLGEVTISVEVWPTVPTVDLNAWDDVAEASVIWPAGPIQVIGANTDDLPGFPVELPAGPGPYRVRAHVRGRDGGEDHGDDDPPEEHLIQLWPASTTPAELLKATDDVGATWRQ